MDCPTLHHLTNYNRISDEYSKYLKRKFGKHDYFAGNYLKMKPYKETLITVLTELSTFRVIVKYPDDNPIGSASIS